MTQASPPRSRGLLAILALGAGVRLYGLGERSLSYDECQQFWASQGNVLVSNREITLDPPGFAALLQVQSGLGWNETWLRLLPCLFGILAILAVYELARAASRNQTTALLAALFCAVAPYSIRYSQSLRVYSEAIFLCALMVTWFLKAREHSPSNGRTLLILAALTAAALLTTYGVAWLVFMMAMALLPGALHTAGGNSRRCLTSVAAGVVAIIPIYLYSLPTQLREGTPASFYDDKFLPTGDFLAAARFLLQGVWDLSSYFSFIHPVAGVIFGALAVWGMIRMSRVESGSVLIWLFVGSLVLAAIASAYHRFPFGGTRQMLFLAPLFYVFVAAGVAGWPQRWRSWMVSGYVAAILIGCGIFMYYYHSLPGGQDMRSVARHLIPAIREGDRVLVNKDAIPQFKFYFRDVGREVVWGRVTVVGDYLGEINRVLTSGEESRWWLVFSHGWKASRQEELAKVDPRFRLAVEQSFEAHRAAAYLLEPASPGPDEAER